MAEGWEPRPAKEIIYRDYYIQNHEITAQSAAGAYYSTNAVDVSVSGYTPISVYVGSWSSLSSIVVPYINYTNNRLGFMASVSLTIGSIYVRVMYEKV